MARWLSLHFDWLTLNLKFPQLSIFCVFFSYQSGRAALHICAERGHLEVAKELLEHKAYVNAKSKVRLYIKDVHYLVHTKNLICSIDGEEPLWNTFPVTHPFVDDVTQCQSDVMLNYLWVCTHSKYGRRKDVRLSLLASKMPGTIFTWVHPYTWVEHLPGHFDLHRGLNTVRIPITLDTENYFQVQISQTFSLLYWRRLHRGRDGRKITWSNKSTEHVSLSVFVQTLSLVSFRWGLLHFIWRQRAATKS